MITDYIDFIALDCHSIHEGMVRATQHGKCVLANVCGRWLLFLPNTNIIVIR